MVRDVAGRRDRVRCGRDPDSAPDEEAALPRRAQRATARPGPAAADGPQAGGGSFTVALPGEYGSGRPDISVLGRVLKGLKAI